MSVRSSSLTASEPACSVLSDVESGNVEILDTQIDGGEGCVAPSTETVRDGSYTPLSRPLFIYVSNSSYADKAQVKAFVDYYVENDADISEQALFVPLSDEQKATAQQEIASLK